MLVWRYLNSKLLLCPEAPWAMSPAGKPFFDALTYCRRNAPRSKEKEDEKRRAGETKSRKQPGTVSIAAWQPPGVHVLEGCLIVWRHDGSKPDCLRPTSNTESYQKWSIDLPITVKKRWKSAENHSRMRWIRPVALQIGFIRGQTEFDIHFLICKTYL